MPTTTTARSSKTKQAKPLVAKKAAKDSGQLGRPAAKTFINVQVKTSTRKALNQLKVITGLKTQGDVLDRLIADAMQRRPR